MIRLLIILFFVLPFCLTSCGQTKTETNNQNQANNIYKIDTSVIAILPLKTQYRIFKNSKPADLTTDDLLKIETILNECINKPENKKLNIDDLTRYKRQYVAIINSKGEKEVWINCFCNTWNTDWKKNLIIVQDGGNCYFNLKMNLTTNKYYELTVNGEA